MNLFSYVVAHDYGFSPNPYADSCVLSLCKYKKGFNGHNSIQDNAKIGDWLAGTGGKSNESSGTDTLLYAMRVTNILPFSEYIKSSEFSEKKLMGYGYDTHPKIRPKGVEHVPVLISDDFYYFGSNKFKLPLHLLSIQKKGPNCKKLMSENAADITLMTDFISWFQGIGEKGKIGNPCKPWGQLK